MRKVKVEMGAGCSALPGSRMGTNDTRYKATNKGTASTPDETEKSSEAGSSSSKTLHAQVVPFPDPENAFLSFLALEEGKEVLCRDMFTSKYTGEQMARAHPPAVRHGSGLSPRAKAPHVGRAVPSLCPAALQLCRAAPQPEFSPRRKYASTTLSRSRS